MARPVENTRLRRILMQSIMWIILAATVALAALVDRTRGGSTALQLTEPVQLKGLRIQLPKGWVGLDDLEPNSSIVEVKEPYDDSWARMIRVTFRRPSIADALGALGAAAVEGVTHESHTLPVGGGEGHLMIRKMLVARSPRGSLYQTQLITTRQVADGRVLTIAMDSFARGRKDIDNDVQLIRRVAESVKFDESQ